MGAGEGLMAIEYVDISSDEEPAPKPILASEQDKVQVPPDSEDEFIDLPKKPGSLAKHLEYTLDGVKVKFPFNAYPSQLDMMTSIIKTLNKNGKSHALLESPTGSGKSLAILCGALAWLEVEKVKKSALLAEYKAKEKAAKAAGKPFPGSLPMGPSFDDILGEPTAKKIKSEPGCGDCSSDCAPALDDNVKYSEEPVEFTPPKIFFASRTHKQLGQLVKELRRSGYSPKFTVLGSRNQYCINDRVRNSKDINDACKEIMKECPSYRGTSKALERMGSGGTNMDIEDLIKFGKSNKACPYFMSRELAASSDIIFAPYNYIMDPGIRSAMGIKLENAIVIIDEAHNIEDTCRDAGSFEITSDSLYSLQTELNMLLSGVGEKAVRCPEAHRSLLHVATIFHTWISTNTVNPSTIKMFEEKVDIWRGQNIPETLKQLGVVPETLETWQSKMEEIVQKSQAMNATNNRKSAFDNGGDTEDDIIMSSGSMRVFQGLFNVLDLMLTKGKQSLDSYRMARIQKVKTERTSRKLEITLGFWCLSPDVIFRPLASKVKSIILTSGTLSPMNTFASELFTKFDEQLEALHVINKNQVWVGCLPNSPQNVQFLGNFKNMETLAFQDELGRCILDVCKVVPYGVLVFLPSYAFMEKLMNRLKSIGIQDQISDIKRIFTEPRAGSAKDFETLMKRFYTCISTCREGKGTNVSSKGAAITGAVFFAVYRGKVSEGLDLADDNCRAVIPVGIPYPAYKDQKVIQKREFNDQRNAATQGACLNGMQWYETQAFRALNQALGRCIRHRLDWGAIILMEHRFTNRNNVQHLSKWVRNDVKTFYKFQDGLESLVRFVDINRVQDKENSAEISEIKKNMHVDELDALIEEDPSFY